MDTEERMDASMWSLANPPPLPDKVYLDNLRLAVNRYRQDEGKIGFTLFAKRYLLPLVTKSEEKNPLVIKSRVLDSLYLNRLLNYWCGKENGQITDQRVVFLVERLLQERAPEYLESFQSRHLRENAARFLSNFLKASPEATDHSHGHHYAGLNPGIFKGYVRTERRRFAGMEETTSELRLAVSAVERSEFLAINIFARMPSRGSVPRQIFRFRLTGYFFPLSWPPVCLVRDQETGANYVFNCYKHSVLDSEIELMGDAIRAREAGYAFSFVQVDHYLNMWDENLVSIVDYFFLDDAEEQLRNAIVLES